MNEPRVGGAHLLRKHVDLTPRISGADDRSAGTTGERLLRTDRGRGLARIENTGIDMTGALEGALRAGRGLSLSGIENIRIADLARTLERALGTVRRFDDGRFDHRRHDHRLLDDRLLHGMRGRRCGLRSNDGARISAVGTRVACATILGTGVDRAGLPTVVIHHIFPLHLRRRALAMAWHGRADGALATRRQGGDSG